MSSSEDPNEAISPPSVCVDSCGGDELEFENDIDEETCEEKELFHSEESSLKVSSRAALVNSLSAVDFTNVSSPTPSSSPSSSRNVSPENDEPEEDDEDDEVEVIPTPVNHLVHDPTTKSGSRRNEMLQGLDLSSGAHAKFNKRQPHTPALYRAATMPAAVLSSPSVSQVEYTEEVAVSSPAGRRQSKPFDTQDRSLPLLEEFLGGRRESLREKFVDEFRKKPKKGVQWLMDNGICRVDCADDVAKVLLECEGISKSRIGKYVGDNGAFPQEVLVDMVNKLDFTGMLFDQALRHFLSYFVLPGEAQQIDRIIEHFARSYFDDNRTDDVFGTPDAAYILAFAIIMLNTDAHNPKIKKRMTKEQFVRNLRGINQNQDLDVMFLEDIYERIVENEIKMKDVRELMDEEEYREMLIKGSVFLKHGRRGKPHSRLVRISEDGTRVSWQPPKPNSKPKYVKMTSVIGVHDGATTAVFGRTRDIREKDKLCFSLVGQRRTLDLEAPTEQIRDLWCQHFQLIVQRNQLQMRARERRRLLHAREEFVARAVREWNEDILPFWERKRYSQHLRQMVLRGIPSTIRTEVWRLLIGNPLRIKEEEYYMLVEQARSTRDAQLQLPSNEQLTGFGDTMMRMKKAVEETFPEVRFTYEGQPLSDAILEVLDAWVMYRPEVGFVEGMSHLAALHLLFNNPCKSFVALANMLQKPCLDIFYTGDDVEIEKKLRYFEQRMIRDVPSLHSHLSRMEITVDMFFTEWYKYLFTKHLPLDICVRIWDWFFLDGEVAIFRTALGVLHCLASRLEHSPREEAMTLLRGRFQTDLSPRALFAAIERTKLTKRKLEKHLYS